MFRNIENYFKSQGIVYFGILSIYPEKRCIVASVGWNNLKFPLDQFVDRITEDTELLMLLVSLFCEFPRSGVEIASTSCWCVHTSFWLISFTAFILKLRCEIRKTLQLF